MTRRSVNSLKWKAMPRITQRWIDKDVLTAARERTAHIFDTFDNVSVSFSGGKDSLVCLYLAKEAAEARGKLPLQVHFYDQELIPDSVVNFMLEVRQYDWVDLTWFCLPLPSSKYILGKVFPYVQWGEGRKWFREMPEFAVRGKPGVIYDKDEYDQFLAARYRGSLACILGIRAQESLMRLRSCLNKVNENYINASGARSMKKCKPIYDWSEADVLKFFSDFQIPFCSIYESQSIAGRPLRVASPFQAEAAKTLAYERKYDGEYFNRLMEAFPEMQVQWRYQKDIDMAAKAERYEQTFTGIEQFIREEVSGKEQISKAFKTLQACRGLYGKKPEAYPIEHIFRHFIRGGFRKMPMPLGYEDQIANNEN
jgi:predicted phosphoadenosine phosphosulfate sulfurtransferase